MERILHGKSYLRMGNFLIAIGTVSRNICK